MSNTILCPLCGGYNTHQIAVRVGFRRTEDEEISPIISVSGASTGGASCAVRLQTTEGHIRGRRHEIQIDVDCEHCGGVSTLTIQQHKGCTNIEWLDGSDLHFD